MVGLADVVAVLERHYPPSTAEAWDVVGLAVGDRSATLDRVLLTVDVTPEVLSEAERVGAGLVLAHHPVLLRGITSVDVDEPKGRLVVQAVRAGVAVYTAHTNADIAVDGVSAALADTLGLLDVTPLVPSERDAGVGTGRVGRLAVPAPAGEWIEAVAAALPATAGGVRLAGDPGRVVERVAVVGGAGDSYLEAAHTAGVDAYLTSDLRHHPVSEALQRRGAPVLVDVAHAAAEATWLPVLARLLTEAFGDRLDVRISTVPTDPWTALALPPTTSATPETSEPFRNVSLSGRQLRRRPLPR